MGIFRTIVQHYDTTINGKEYTTLGVTRASLKDGLGGRLRLIKGVLRLQLGL